MTRDEAVETFVNAQRSFDREWSESWIDGLAALGILKLDEPKSEIDRLAEKIGWSRKGLCDALDRTGLKLVQK